jgi:predicted NAD/FAD-binding protein
VVVFEREPRLGGHAYTVRVPTKEGDLPLDLGFLVYNERNYPGFSALLRELRVETVPTEMELTVERVSSGRTLSGGSFAGLIRGGRHLLEPWFWSVVVDQLRFSLRAVQELQSGTLSNEESLRHYQLRHGFREDFYSGYLRPLAAAIWSMPPHEVDDFPVRALLEFLNQHGLITLLHRPRWRTILGGSERYVHAWQARIPAQWALSTAVERIRRRPTGGVELRIQGVWAPFDRAILAVHSDQALALLEDATALEIELLSAVRYRESELTLHRDPAVLPADPRTWASWNVKDTAAENGGVAITYLLDRLQPVSVPGPWCVTLNGTKQVQPEKILHRTQMSHPQMDSLAVQVRERWRELLAGNPILFAGAYWGHGFHEDGFQSGLRAASALESPQ